MASPGRAVYVVWIDHAKTEGDPKGLKLVERHTLGWVVKETHKSIVLAMDVNGKGKDRVREYGFIIRKTDVQRIETVSLG